MRNANRDIVRPGARRDGALFLTAIAAYGVVASQLVQNGFRADDWTFLAHTRSAGSWLDLVTPTGHFAFYRPAALVLFRIEHLLFGLDAAGYLLVNVLLHAANAALGARVLMAFGMGRRAAGAAAFLFLLGAGHLGKQVGWACAGGPLASVTACLVAMASAAALAGGASAWRALPGLIAGIVVAPLCHESGALAPLYVGLLLGARRSAGAPSRRIAIAATASGAVAVLGWIGLLLSLRTAYPAYPGAAETVLRAPGLFLRYLGLLVFPVQPEQWSVAPVVHASIGTLAIAAAAVTLARARRHAGLDPRSMLWLWLFATLAPYAIVPMPGLWLEPRYLYFAALPFGGLAIAGIEVALPHLAARRLQRPALGVAAAGIAAILVFQLAFDARRRTIAAAEQDRGLAAMAAAEHTWRMR